MMRHLSGLVVSLLVVVPVVATAQVPGQEPERFVGITVSGTGEVSAKPNLVEIDLRSSGSAELAGDAIVKYRDNKRRIQAAFDALKLKNLRIVEKGISLGSSATAQQMQMMMQGMPGQGAGKPQVEISRTLRLTLQDVQDVPEEELIETITKLLDVAKDSGAGVGPTAEATNMAYRYGQQVNATMTTFVLDNLAELREQAYRKAVDDARDRAQRLASLTGVRLGSVLSVQEILVSGDEAVPGQPYYYGYPGAMSPTEVQGPRVTSPTFAEIPIRVKLLVRFGIAKPEAEAAQK